MCYIQYHIYFSLLAFQKVGGYEAMLDGYRNATAEPEYAAYKYNIETGKNESCRSIQNKYSFLGWIVWEPCI